MRREVRYTINPSGDKERHPELFKVPLGKLRAEVDRLHTLANQGNTYALIRLESAQAILDRRMVVEEQVWKQRHPEENGHAGQNSVHYHNNVSVPPSATSSTSIVAAFGIGAALAAAVFLALSGLAALFVVGLCALFMIMVLLGVVVFLHRRREQVVYEVHQNEPASAAARLQVQPLETPTELISPEHKCLTAVSGHLEAVKPQRLVRKSTALSIPSQPCKKVRSQQ